jgi:hypothetical protein
MVVFYSLIQNNASSHPVPFLPFFTNMKLPCRILGVCFFAETTRRSFHQFPHISQLWCHFLLDVVLGIALLMEVFVLRQLGHNVQGVGHLALAAQAALGVIKALHCQKYGGFLKWGIPILAA